MQLKETALMSRYNRLLANAVAGLTENTADARHNLYDRARRAFVAGLLNCRPPLSPSEAAFERSAFEQAVRTVEAETRGRTSLDAIRKDQMLNLTRSDMADHTAPPREEARRRWRFQGLPKWSFRWPVHWSLDRLAGLASHLTSHTPQFVRKYVSDLREFVTDRMGGPASHHGANSRDGYPRGADTGFTGPQPDEGHGSGSAPFAPVAHPSGEDSKGKQLLHARIQAMLQVARYHGMELDVNEFRFPSGQVPTAAALSLWAQSAGMWSQALRIRWKHLLRLNETGPVVLLFNDGSAGLMTGVNAEQNIVFLKDPFAVADVAGAPVDELRLSEVWSGEAILLRANRGQVAEDAPFNLRWLIDHAVHCLKTPAWLVWIRTDFVGR